VFTVGYRNRFNHPRDDVVERYRAGGSALLRTDVLGAIEMRLAPGSLRVEGERERSRRYWDEG